MKRIHSCILAVTVLASAAWVQASEAHLFGGLLGGVVGAAVGQHIGGDEGAVVGAAIGGLTGIALADQHDDTRIVERRVVEVREPQRVVERVVVHQPRVVEHVIVQPEPRRVVRVERRVERVVYESPRHERRYRQERFERYERHHDQRRDRW